MTFPTCCKKRLASLLLAGLFSGLSAGAYSGYQLPPKAAKVIHANFPKAKITHVGREREHGAWYYEVVLHEGKRRYEVEITDEGVIGEIEAKIKFTDMPPEIRAYVIQKVGDGGVVRVEKHERRGVARSGKFVPLKKKRIMYEVKYVSAEGYKRELQVASNGILELPARVRQQIRAAYPGARIQEVEAEDDDGIMVFVVGLKSGQHTFHLSVLADGSVMEKEIPIPLTATPAAVQKAVRNDPYLRRQHQIRICKAETFATVEDEKVVSRYDLHYVVRIPGADGKEYRFDGRGRRTEVTLGGDEDDDEEDDDEDDEEDDDDDDEHHHRRGHRR